MTPTKLSDQIQLHLDAFVACGFRGRLDFGPDSAWADIPLKQYPQALDMLCEKIKELPQDLDRAYIAGKIMGTIDEQYRKQLVERNILGKSLGVVYSQLGQEHGEVIVWNESLTSVSRLNNDKHCRLDLRALGQIWRDVPALFAQALSYDQTSVNAVASNILLWIFNTVERDAKRKNPTLNSQVLDDLAWAMAGMLENSDPRSNTAIIRAIPIAQLLVQAGAQIPAVDIDGNVMERAADGLYKPAEQGRIALRRAILMKQAQAPEGPARPKPTPKM